MKIIVRLAVTCTGLYTVTVSRKITASVKASLTTELSQSNKDHSLAQLRKEQTYIMVVPSAQASNQPTYLTRMPVSKYTALLPKATHRHF